MSARPPTRRHFLQTAAAGGAHWGLGDLGFLSRVPPVSAQEAKLDPKVVRLQPEIEPLVRLLEETPRERLLEEVAARTRNGLSYREVVAALLLAGVRNVEPRPDTGHKFHAVLVVNSAHLASLSGPDSDRWLPIFWALDHFKSMQWQDEREGNWTMRPVDEKAVPPARKARQAFIAAMDNWDEPAADAAVAGLAHTAGAHELFELFCRYGARDFRDIGHKAIFVANSWRTLQCIGWQHAEPVLRSLAYGLLSHEGEDNPAKRDAPADRPWRRNLGLAAMIRPDWREGKVDPQATSDLLATLREGSAEDASSKVVELLNRGSGPQSIWNALLAGAGELLMHGTVAALVALHAVTCSNALRHCYEASSNDETRRLLLLQNAAFLPLFRDELYRRNGLSRRKEVRIDQLEPAPPKAPDPQGVIEEIFADESWEAARKTLAYLKENPQPKPLIDAARRLVFLKGNDSHHYKFSSAVLEDYVHLSPAWRDRFLAVSMFQLPSSRWKDNELVRRTRAALKG